MWILVIALIVSSKELNLIEQEIEEITRLKSLLKSKEQSLEELENSLKESRVEIPTGNTWKTIPGLLPSPLDFTFSDKLELQEEVRCLGHIQSLNSFLLISQSNLYTLAPEAGISKRHSLPVQVDSCVINSFNFLLYSPTIFRSGWLSSNLTEIHLTDEITLFNDPSVKATSAAFYNYLNKKYWVVGDSQGALSLFTDSGEFKTRGFTDFPTISNIERSGQDLIVAGEKAIGLYSLASMKMFDFCENPASPVIYLGTKPSNNQLFYAVLESGDILVYDTKFSMGSIRACKPVYRHFNRYQNTLSRISFLGGWIVQWNGKYLSLFDTSESAPTHYTVDFLETSSNSFVQTAEQDLVLVNGRTLLMARVDSHVDIPQENNEQGYDIGDIRIVAIVIGVSIVVFYRIMANKKDNNVSKRLDKFKSTLDGMNLKANKKEDKKKHVRFSGKSQTYRYAEDEGNDSD